MDLPSDSDESDVDFVPGAEESFSEAESDVDKETDAQYDNEVQIKKDNKRLSASSSRKKKSKRIKRSSDSKEDSKPETELNKDPVVQKKYEDDLWASFLDAPTPKKALENKEKETSNSDKSEKSNDIEDDDRFGPMKSGTEIPMKKSNIFDTEELNTSNDTKSPAQSSTSEENAATPTISAAAKPRNSGGGGGGLSSILSKIGKNNKVSTLEKSKLDWNSFKKDEGIEDEIGVHNRGRNGYLERQDFLERTDHRQFELEKSLRANKRTKR